MQLLGSPQEALWVIHIAGTKGKGSTCAFVANILREAGFRVGLYSSPHLLDVRERIRILQPSALSLQLSEKELISQKDFTRLIEKIKPQAEKLRETKLGKLSYYEVLTACAFLYFKESTCDFVVLETGIGGRLDATNLVESSICAITPISYEHTQVLGTTLKKIAAEKAGIIKSGTGTVVTAPQRPSVLRIIRRRAKQCRTVLFEVGKDIQIKERSFSLDGQSFDVQGIYDRYTQLSIGLLGRHQFVNAAVAIGCVECLCRQGVRISRKAIREGLKKTDWPGRLQIVSQRPRLILDGAQNRASACALKDALKELFKSRSLILVLGVSQGKDIKGILEELAPCASRIILTKAQNPRAMEPRSIKDFIKANPVSKDFSNGVNAKAITSTNSLPQALKLARENARPKDLILVTGSLFLVGEALGDILPR